MTDDELKAMMPREPTEEDRARLRAWLDRKPPDAHADHCPRANGNLEDDCSCNASGLWRRDWFLAISENPSTPLVYLGERSARTGPDNVGAAQRCLCEQCTQEKP